MPVVMIFNVVRVACLSTLLHGEETLRLQCNRALGPDYRPSGLRARGRLGTGRSFVESLPIGTRFLELRTCSLPTRHHQHNNYVVAKKIRSDIRCLAAYFGHDVVAAWTVPSHDHRGGLQ
jgi:hypothetical protein